SKKAGFPAKKRKVEAA
nr:Chain A, Prototypical P4[R]cNLS [synthetic construct]